MTHDIEKPAMTAGLAAGASATVQTAPAVSSNDVGTTPRKRLTTRDRLSIWETHKGICCICNVAIDGVREKWIVEHRRALELGGADTRDNMAPAHFHCAAVKTQNDHSMAAEAKARKAIQINANAQNPRGFPKVAKPPRISRHPKLPPPRIYEDIR